MGRSFARVLPENTPKLGKPFYHKASGSYFAMIARDGKLYQRRWQIGFDGKETNVDEKQADFVVGSGNHSKTYLHLTSRNALEVLPLSWYSEKGGYWDMSPGTISRTSGLGSPRALRVHVLPQRLSEVPPAARDVQPTRNDLSRPLPQGIDCQRCHGPGQRHVDLASAGAKPEQIRAAIVNPKRLDPDRELEVCLQCHLETTSLNLPHSIRRFDRAPFSYVPGSRWAISWTGSIGPAAGSNNDRFEIAHGAYRLRQSQCYLKSAGKLRCTMCHDPHDIPRGPAATAHYNGVCSVPCGHAAAAPRLPARTPRAPIA